MFTKECGCRSYFHVGVYVGLLCFTLDRAERLQSSEARARPYNVTLSLTFNDARKKHAALSGHSLSSPPTLRQRFPHMLFHSVSKYSGYYEQ